MWKAFRSKNYNLQFHFKIFHKGIDSSYTYVRIYFQLFGLWIYPLVICCKPWSRRPDFINICNLIFSKRETGEWKWISRKDI